MAFLAAFAIYNWKICYKNKAHLKMRIYILSFVWGHIQFKYATIKPNLNCKKRKFEIQKTII